MLQFLAEKFFLQPISIPFFFAALIVPGLSFCSDIEKTKIAHIIYFSMIIIITIIYSFLVAKHRILPKCPKDKIGVLFILKTATKEQFSDFEYLITGNFEAHSKTIKPIFIRADSLKDYNFSDKECLNNLLSKTNCKFCIDFFLESNDKNDSTKFITTIRTDILSLNSNDDMIDISSNLTFASEPIKSIHFDLNDKLDKIKNVSEYIDNLIYYIYGLLLLVNGETYKSYTVLKHLLESIDDTHKLHNLVTNAASYSAMKYCLLQIEDYYDTLKLESLEKAEQYLAIANTIQPNTYEYHLNMSTLQFLKYRNIDVAKKHVNVCKKINKNDIWKYNEAFLLAYETNNPNIAYSKYIKLKDNAYNDLYIIKFIERILESEPNKFIFYLVLGILYNNRNEELLANCNLRHFLFLCKDKRHLRQGITSLSREIIKDNLCNICKDKEQNTNCLINKN